jgi:hypothetical protein
MRLGVLAVRLAGGDEFEHLALPRREAERVGGCVRRRQNAGHRELEACPSNERLDIRH